MILNKKALPFITVISILVVIFVAFLILHEPYENDRIPTVLTPIVKITVIKENEYHNEIFKNGSQCKENQ